MAHAVWTVLALEPPCVPRRCPRCDAPRRFASSGKFRVNAQKKRLDVWLVYNCPECDASWNAPIVERATRVEGLDRYHGNDPATAWRCAFAVPGADRAGVPWRVERPPLADPPLAVRVELADPVSVRLDRLLAGELGLGRAEIARRAAGGDLRRPVAHGQLVVIS